MRIRPATSADTEQMAVAHKDSIAELCSACYPAEAVSKWVGVIAPGIYESAIADKVTLVAEVDGHVVGLGILNLMCREIDAVYIHPRVKGRGIGAAILAELERTALADGAQVLTLRSTVNALGFYKHHDYIETGRTSHELPDGTRLQCIAMRKVLCR